MGKSWHPIFCCKLRFVLALLRAAIQGGDRPLMLRLLSFIRHAQPQRFPIPGFPDWMRKGEVDWNYLHQTQEDTENQEPVKNNLSRHVYHESILKKNLQTYLVKPGHPFYTHPRLAFSPSRCSATGFRFLEVSTAQPPASPPSSRRRLTHKPSKAS